MKSMAIKMAAVAAGGACLAGCLLMSSADAAGKNPVAGRVAADFAGQSGAPVWHYAVPAMSEIQRLPDVYPTDGVPGGTVRIVAAKDEYEAGSFLVWAQNNQGKVDFSLSEFKNEKGEAFPKDALDLKVVKVWYQNRNGWFSYFGDTGFKLCPELLLNDEDLIRVDTKNEANYARLVAKDGKKSELWINPPRQMDVRQLSEGWRQTDTFKCMREDFHDAATLQPVALPEKEFRSFFLTAHVAKNAKPGLYRGEVRMAKANDKGDQRLGTIPVEIRVLDFALPEPKCYAEPEKDFLVSSYSYISYGLIRERNGFASDDVTRRQFVAVLKDQVAHNQKMHWVRGSFDKEAFDTIECMREAGMRMDVFQGAVFSMNGKPEDMRAHAQILADEFDRRYGHHNVYIGYGDEPGAAWLAQMRPMFEAYQGAGLKYIIAGHSVFTKAGYIYDWHNCADDATESSIPALWGKMNNATHNAWYANQHVGSENPAFNRRQNGLGAYLAGYTALCNYAHHFGPYNDDSTTYKPMVLAYGSYDGVIDTIAWEGFREGVDDIRYATLMTDLARKAQKSKDVKVRYLGGKAMQLLALADPKGCDQDQMRGEMIRFIEQLRPLVAPYAVGPETKPDVAAAKAGAARAEANLKKAVDAELAKMSAARNPNETNKVHDAVANAYRRYGRPDEATAYLKKVGREWKPSLWDRIAKDPAVVKTAFDAEVFKNLKPTDTNGFKRAIGSWFGNLTRNNNAYVARERPASLAAVWEHLVPLAEKWGVTAPADAAKNAVWAYVQLRNAGGAAKAARFGLKDEKAKPAEKYYLGLAIAMERVGGRPDAFFKAAKKYDETVKDIPNKDRVSALCAYGSAVMNAGGENAVRGLNDFRKSLYKPEPKKRYQVQFSEMPITGFGDWAKITAERQAYDRRYGGNMDFLVTDVTTGARAVGNSKDKLADPTMEVVADVNGLHFLVRCADPKAKEVALGLVGNCSFEGYIAPGANTPYACFMYNPSARHAGIFNTTYPTVGGARRLDPDGQKVRFQSEYGDGETRHYFFFSWENWMQRVPTEGSVWDFENMCWHRSGNSCWNGTESIHGRSTWGELEFHLTPAQRAMIVKGLLVTAYREYNAEKRTQATYDGALAHWQDASLGDLDFYNAQVKPLADELNKYGQLITADMTDANVFWLEKNALPRWQDIRYEVARRRAAWLLEKNAK